MVKSRRLRHLLQRTREWVISQDTSDLAEKRRLLRKSCFSKQRDAFDDRAKRMSTRVGRGGGKTTCIRAREVDCGLAKPGAQILYFANTREQAERLMWDPLKSLLTELELDYKPYEAKLCLRILRTESEIQLAGAPDRKSIETWRGESRDMVDIDECGSLPKHILDHIVYRIVGPRLADRDGVLALWGTPGIIPAGPFYETNRPGSELGRPYKDRNLPEFADWEGWSSHHWYLLDGAPHVPALAALWEEAQREKRRNKWSDDHPVWRREYLAEWASDDSERMYRYRPHDDEGLEWNQWNPKRSKRGVAELPEGREWFYVYGMDSGIGDPFALEVFAFRPDEGVLHHVYEFIRPDMHAQKIAKLLLGEELDIHNPTGIIRDTGWPDAMVGDMPPSLLEELSKVYGIQVGEAKRRQKLGSIELFNGDLLEGRVKILKDSKLEEQLMHLTWSVDTYGERKEPKSERNDAADAATYARSAAGHQFVSEPEPARPPRGSRERDDLEAREAEERAAREGDPDGFEDLLLNESYDFLK
jgi:hypothetical protein